MRRRVPRSLLVAAGLLVVAAAATVVLWPERDTRIATIGTDAAALIDPGEPALRASVKLDGPPSAVAVGPGAIWMAGDRDGTVSRIDPKTHELRGTVKVGRGPSALAADRGGVWAANSQDGTISYVSAGTNTVTDTIGAGSPSDVCLLDGDLWVPGASAGSILRIDPSSHRRRTITLGAGTASIACGEGGVWTVGDSGRLMGISPVTNSVLRTLDVGAGAGAVAAGEGAVWVANPLNGTVTRVDPERGVVTATVPVGRADEPVGLATGDGAVWVANRKARTLARIDPERAVVTERLRLGNEPRALAVSGSQVWAAVTATGAGHRGGTLRIAMDDSIDALDADPATSYDVNAWMLLSLAYDGLTAFRRTGGRAGTQVVPNLAQALPAPSDGGTTYTFVMRPGARFSTGLEVRASDVKRGIDRSLARRARGVRAAGPDRVGRGRRSQPHRRDPLGAARSGPAVSARVAVRSGRSPGGPEAAGHRPGDRPVPDRGARPAAHAAGAQPLLPGLVAAGEAGRLPGRHRGRLRRQRRRGRRRRSAPAAATTRGSIASGRTWTTCGSATRACSARRRSCSPRGCS